MSTTVYIARDISGSVLYVGITGSVPARLADHDRYSTWWKQAESIDLEHYTTRQEALRREFALITQHDPPFNILRVDPDLIPVRKEAAQRQATEDAERPVVIAAMYREGVLISEIASHVGWSKKRVEETLRGLRKQGVIQGYRQPPYRKMIASGPSPTGEGTEAAPTLRRRADQLGFAEQPRPRLGKRIGGRVRPG